MSRAARLPTASAPVRIAALPRLGHLDQRWIGEPSRKEAPHRLEQEVAVGPQAATEDHEADVGDGRDGGDVQSDAASRLCTTPRPS